jgi:hypothetical protein
MIHTIKMQSAYFVTESFLLASAFFTNDSLRFVIDMDANQILTGRAPL